TAPSGGSGGFFESGFVAKLTAPGAPLPTCTTFGHDCPGAAGAPWLLPSGPPRLDSPAFTLTVANSAGGALALLLLGVSDVTSLLGPLPVDLSPLGLPGCQLLTSADVTQAGLAGVDGRTPFALPIPNLPPLLGARLIAQGFAAEPAANAAGLTGSRGLTLRVGS